MLNLLLKILFPSPCVSCGLLSEALCNACFLKLRFCPHVRIIGEKIDGETGEIYGGMKICSSMYYQPDSVLEALLHPFKYKHQADIFRLFVPHMIEALRILREPLDLILVPVPLHKKRELDRGYNQAELLAKWVAMQVGCRVGNLLERVKDTGSQARVSSSHERQRNMRDAFKATRTLPKDSQIVLVDDIVTTGSTLLACRDALIAAGAGEVTALTLADREKNPENPWD